MIKSGMIKTSKNLQYVQKIKASTQARALNRPHANIEDLETEYLITVAAPGFHRQELNIDIANGKILVRSNKTATSCNTKILNLEYDLSNWERRFVLPKDADTMFTKASYHNGELALRVPKNNNPLLNGDIKIEVY